VVAGEILLLVEDTGGDLPSGILWWGWMLVFVAAWREGGLQSEQEGRTTMRGRGFILGRKRVESFFGGVAIDNPGTR